MKRPGKLILLFLSVVVSAQAQTIITNINHPALGPGAMNFSSPAPGIYASLTNGGVIFSGAGGVKIESLYAGQYNSIGQYLNNNDSTNSLMTITFQTPMAAFGFNYGASDDTWTLSAFDAGNNLIASATIPAIAGSANGEFIGIASPTANIAYATFKDNGGMWYPDWILMDNFKRTEVPYGTNAPPIFVTPTVTPAGTGVIVSWATNVIGFHPQVATNLAPPFVWETVHSSTGPAVVDGYNQLTVPVALEAPALFFRLSNGSD